MKRQDPLQRIKNFFEVAQGLTENEAVAEATRCLNCKKPACVKGCPVEIDIADFILLIKQGKFSQALSKIKEKNSLPAICGRICPQENQCEAVCVLGKKGIPINPVRSKASETVSASQMRTSNGVNIGALERFAADHELSSTPQVTRNTSKACNVKPETRNVKVAVVGSGPAGLTAAGELAKTGYSVTLFESLHLAGGVLAYGIPEFRLPKKIVRLEVDYIKSLGVELKTDILIGKTLTLADLFSEGYVAIFVGTGAGLPQFLGIPGENLPGVYSANEFLTRINLMKAYKFPEYATPVNIGKRVAVIGAGNVAFDCTRCAIRLGSKVSLVYRRSQTEMPAREEEIQNAKEEGLEFNLLTQPVKILSTGIDLTCSFKGRVIANNQGKITGLECIKMQLGDPDASGRRRPLPIEGSNFVLDIDTVIVAVGQNPNPLLIKSTPELKTRDNGTIIVDQHFHTSMKGVFAGGDIITGADTVISAMGAGKKAAREIDSYIKQKKD